MVTKATNTVGMLGAALVLFLGIAWALVLPPPWFLNWGHLRFSRYLSNLTQIESYHVHTLAEWAGEPNLLVLHMQLRDGGRLELVVSGEEQPDDLSSLQAQRIGDLRVSCLAGGLFANPILDLRRIPASDIDGIDASKLGDVVSSYRTLVDAVGRWKDREITIEGKRFSCTAVDRAKH